jgi:RNA polymerase sigma factor (sigma-70 family)
LSSIDTGISSWASMLMDYRALSVNVCRGIVDDTGLAEDVVQCVIIVIIDKLRSGRLTFSSGDHLRNYLLKSIRNRSQDVLRDREKWLRESEGIHAGTEGGDQDPLQLLISREEDERRQHRLDLVMMGLQSLKRDEKNVIELRFLRGKKYREISEMTGIPITTLKSREDSALKKLRKKIVKSEAVP